MIISKVNHFVNDSIIETQKYIALFIYCVFRLLFTHRIFTIVKLLQIKIEFIF
jgi:hypothetical protein